jgi:homopolymeric O-antigen transport system ATP-binding protein
MSDAVIAVEGLSKRYMLDHQQRSNDDLRHVIEAAFRSPFQFLRSQRDRIRSEKKEFWALCDVSFSVAQGEAIGIVGRNGAGKSTLLKLLSRITEPTAGRIRYRGRVASLLEVGTGFHPELTGRENIYLNAAILGMKRAEIERRFDEIVAFSEVEQFLDTPVKRYSSGMYVRLAFGVAAHLEPEILLVDEVLAVGDAAFQKKCLGKMGNVVKEGRTVLFVSHNMAAVSSLCTRGLLIDQGRLVWSGSPQSTIERYLASSPADSSQPLSERKDRRGEGKVRLTRITVMNDRHQEVDTVTAGQDVTFAIDYDIPAMETLRHVVVQIKFASVLGQPLFACLSGASGGNSMELRPGGRLLCKIPRLPLTPGFYPFTVWCMAGGNLQDHVAEAGQLSVADGDYFGTGKLPPKNTGDFLVAHDWVVE